MKKILKISVLVLSVGVIAFCVIKMVNPDLLGFLNNSGSNGGAVGDYTKIADLLYEKTEAECEFEITAHANGEVNVGTMCTDKFGNRSGRNSYYPADQLYDCKYTDDIIFWDIEYGKDYDHFASVVPDDCVGAEIRGVLYKSKTAEIQFEGKTYSIKYVLTDLEHNDLADGTREVLLIDEKGKAHEEIDLVNPFN